MSVESFYEILHDVQDENTKIPDFFPERLRVFRIARNLGQAELGKVVDRTASTISDWEKGKTQPGLRDIELMANRLDVSPARLAFGDIEVAAPSISASAGDLTDPIAAECIDIVREALDAAGEDKIRYGWIREQLLQHLRIPSHWGHVTPGVIEAKRLMADLIEDTQRNRAQRGERAH